MSTLHFSTEQKRNLDSLSGGSNSHDDNPMRGDFFFFSFSEIGSHVSQPSCISENDLELLILYLLRAGVHFHNCFMQCCGLKSGFRARQTNTLRPSNILPPPPLLPENLSSKGDHGHNNPWSQNKEWPKCLLYMLFSGHKVEDSWEDLTRNPGSDPTSRAV